MSIEMSKTNAMTCFLMYHRLIELKILMNCLKTIFTGIGPTLPITCSIETSCDFAVSRFDIHVLISMAARIRPKHTGWLLLTYDDGWQRCQNQTP
ncbi:MAG TPA: hypothetical protein DCM28_19095 [Phycisphaerales bacterium]|nr:hypothetical protein [Phycisphaerales bacterium]HCD34714.1 hypothetical protein [Phycisphaerales bacterium]